MGYPQGKVIAIALDIVATHFSNRDSTEVLDVLARVLNQPAAFENDPLLAPIAQEFLQKKNEEEEQIRLNTTGAPFNIYGPEHIEAGALEQMRIAVRLPVSVRGALMPDAHSGYGLPIGGVLAAENAIIPYGVGVDIGCRMCLSVFDIDPGELNSREAYFTRELNEATLFGSGKEFEKTPSHEVLEHSAFREIPLLRSLQNKAARQLGTSGSGNHFVEFGVIEIDDQDEVLGIAPGKYLGLLSHSGSRALGANIANHYTHIAKEKRRLPAEASNLAWLDMDEAEGIEYWMAMNLAGDYASACHHVIHEKLARQLGREPLKMVENHHNFAWKEKMLTPEGREQEVIVHRKGATPAARNVLGIIPGSMTAPGFIVKGKGEANSLASASHGAGRRMSRTAALKSITRDQLSDILHKHGVKLMGGGLDEAPFAYKNIETVMQAQQELVDIVGKFIPKIVKMDGTPPRERKSRSKNDSAVEGE